MAFLKPKAGHGSCRNVYNYLEHGEEEAFRRITRKALNFIAIAATPLAVYFMLYAREGIGFLSGSAYEGAVLPMQIIMPTLFLIGMTNIMGIQILVPLGEEKVVLKSEIAGAVTDFVLNMILIPKFHSAGAAVGTLVAELVVLIWQYAALRGRLRDAIREIKWGSILGAILAGAAVSVWMKWVVRPENEWMCLLVLFVTAILFFGCYALILTLRKEPLVLEMEDTALRKVHIRK